MCLVSPRRLPEQLTQFLVEQFLMQEAGADDGDAYLHVEMVQVGCVLSVFTVQHKRVTVWASSQVSVRAGRCGRCCLHTGLEDVDHFRAPFWLAGKRLVKQRRCFVVWDQFTLVAWVLSASVGASRGQQDIAAVANTIIK